MKDLKEIGLFILTVIITMIVVDTNNGFSTGLFMAIFSALVARIIVNNFKKEIHEFIDFIYYKIQNTFSKKGKNESKK